MKKILFALIALCAFVSCDETITEPDGYATDTIKLSTDKLDTYAQGGEYVVTTQGEHWWINYAITINGEHFYLYDSNEPIDDDENHIEAQVDPQSGKIVSFSYEWFTVTRSSPKEIRIKLEPNYTEHSRSLSITPQAGNYFGNLSVTQEGAAVSGLAFSDIVFKGDELTIAEAQALKEQIEADAYSGFQSYINNKMRLFTGEDAANFIEYNSKQEPKEEELTDKEKRIMDRLGSCVEDNPTQIYSYWVLSNEDESTIMFLTNPQWSKSYPLPASVNIDVTDRYTSTYPKLEYAYVSYLPQYR